MEALQAFLGTNPLIELWIVTLMLVGLGYLTRLFGQPVIIWYILGWVLLWPEIFNLIQNHGNIEFYAHFWVSLLLFMVWLGLNPKIVKEVWKIAVVAWVGQVVFTFIIWYGIALALWFSHIMALFLGISLTFSSTIVIIKLISDRGDAWTTYGKIALWVLIVQDIIAMIILLIISWVLQWWGVEALSTWFFVRTALSVARLLGFARFSWHFILPKVMRALSKENELLLLFVITWAILFWGMRYYAGFTMEIGALIAWVTLASSRWRFHIFSELRPFRDFFLALFFVYIGWQIVFDDLNAMLVPIIIFSLFVLIGNPAIIITLMMKLGYNRKDSFMTGLTVAQISEFAFIIIGLALTAWLLEDPMILSTVTFIGLITMTGSSYMFAHAETIFKRVDPLLQKLTTKKSNNDVRKHSELPEHIDENVIIIIGYWRLGSYMASQLKSRQVPFCIIDNDIKKIALAEEKGYKTIYGDADDTWILDQLIGTKTQWVYSTVPNYDSNLQLVSYIEESHPLIKTVLLALYIEEAESLYDHWADYVIQPHISWAHEWRDILEKHIRDSDAFIKQKMKSRAVMQQHKTHKEDKA